MASVIHQHRRKVTLTVHREQGEFWVVIPGPTIPTDDDVIRVANASPTRDIVVTRVWFESEPRYDVYSGPHKRLPPDEPWELTVPVTEPHVTPDMAPWLVRCMLSPDDKIVKSKPRKRVPPIDAV